MELKIATASDSKEIGQLVWMLLEELCGEDSCGLTIEELQHRAKEFIESGRVTAILAKEAELALGIVTLNDCCAVYAGKFGEITEFYVRPESRCMGVGAKLMESAIEFASKREWMRLEVGTPELPEWHRTAKFYQQNGFDGVGGRMKRILKSTSA